MYSSTTTTTTTTTTTITTTKELSISLFVRFRIVNFGQIKLVFCGSGNF